MGSQISAAEKACHQCYKDVAVPEDSVGCPVAEAILTDCDKRLKRPTIASRAAWILLRHGTEHAHFTSKTIEGEIFSQAESATLASHTKHSRLMSGVRRIGSLFGSEVMSVDKSRLPNVYTFEEAVVTGWCTEQVPPTQQVVTEPPEPEVVVDPAQFKHLKVLPGLAQITFNYIMSENTDHDTELAITGAFEATVTEALKGTKRPKLVHTSLNDASGRCLSQRYIRQYGRTPFGKQRFTRVSMIRETLQT